MPNISPSLQRRPTLCYLQNEMTRRTIDPDERFLQGVAAGIDSGTGPRQKPGLRREWQFGFNPTPPPPSIFLRHQI